MAIEVTLNVPPPTEDVSKLSSRKVTFEHIPAEGETADPPVIVSIDPMTSPTVKGLVKKGQNYDVYFQSTDKAGNESLGINRLTITAVDTKAPDPDATPEVVSMDEVADPV